MDSYILGDVYILGFSMDFSEIDLWWLLNRKKNEKAIHGNVYFYVPYEESFSEINELLKVYGVKVIHCDCSIEGKDKKERDKIYPYFYEKAIQDIEKKMSQNK